MFPPMVETAQPEAVRRQIGRVGVWLGPIGLLPACEERAAVRRIEAAGYGAIWFGEAPQNRETLSHAGLLLAAGERISVATGIANIWARDPIAAANGADTAPEFNPSIKAATDEAWQSRVQWSTLFEPKPVRTSFWNR